MYIKTEVKERVVLKKVASVCKRSTVLFSRLDVTLTRTRGSRHADGESRCLETRVAAMRVRSTILRDKNCQNFGHRPESVEGMTFYVHHHLGSRLSTTCIIGASSEFTQRSNAPQHTTRYAGFDGIPRKCEAPLGPHDSPPFTLFSVSFREGVLTYGD